MNREKFLELFKQISKIPHPSGQTEQLLNYIREYAQDRGLEAIENNGNLIIDIPESPGYSALEPVIVQGHLDMVAEKEPGSQHDFSTDPLMLDISEDGKWLSAESTTLGGDDGAAIAYMMMLMDEKKAKHPKIYCVFTRDEETGILGASALDYTLIGDAKYMVNLDTLYEGVMTVGAGGGEGLEATYSYEMSNVLGSVWELTVSGLTGGHSAAGANGAHAAKVLAQIMGHLLHTTEARLIRFDCAGRDNVVTSSGKVLFVTSADKNAVVENTILISKIIATAYNQNDPDIKIDLKQRPTPEKVMAFTDAASRNIIFNILYLPTGVMVSESGSPRASSNIGNLKAANGIYNVRIHMRFNSEPLRELIKNKIVQFLSFTGAVYKMDNYSPAWIKQKDSKLQEIARNVWKDSTGEDLTVMDVHGTVEGGIFQQRMPDLDIISIGPTVEKIHSPEERLDIDSADRVYIYLLEILSNLNKKGEGATARAPESDVPGGGDAL